MNWRVRKFLAACTVAGALAVAVGQATAHHSMAVYDAFSITVEGTVQEFKYVNPHSIILLKVSAPNGGHRIWYLEGDPPATPKPRRISRDMFHSGDRLN